MKAANPYAVLKLMHQAMFVVQVFFAAIVFYLVYSKTIESILGSAEKMLQVIALVFAAGAIYGSKAIFKKKLALIKEQPLSSNTEKIARYRTACIIQWALLEAASFICILCFFVTGNFAFLALAAILIIYFALQAPSKSKVAQHLDMSSSELDGL